MKYTECDERSDDVVNLPEPDKTAYRIIRTLYGRKGFDDWWDQIEDEDKNDLFEKLKEVIPLS